MSDMVPVQRIRRCGFTLLEILIVVGIIALLAAFVVPNLMNTQKKALIQMTQSAIDSGGPIAKALTMFHLHMGAYPRELKELSEQPDNDDQHKWAGPYIEDPTKLKDPWGEEYQYRFPSQHQNESSANHPFLTQEADSYDLWSKGPDRQDGTDDDIANWVKQ